MNWGKVEKDIESGPGGTFKWIVITVVAFVLLSGGVAIVTKPTNMAVERVVMKQSFQYKEGMQQRAAILEANIIEVDSMIQQFPDRRNQLQAQKRVLTAQLRAITINN